MDQRKITCVCRQQFTVIEYTEHYTRCELFQKKFKEFDLRIGELLKTYSKPKENLLIIKFLLGQYINVIDKKIKDSYEAENDLIFCRKCKINPDIIYLSSCNHPICKKCFIESAEKNIFDMKCNICQQMTIDLDKRNILGESRMNELEKKALNEVIENIIKCPNCGEQNEFEEGKVDYNVRDEKNQILSKEAAEDYAKHRCRCGFCKKDFCINPNCKAIPYHLGKTCEKYKDYIKSKKCRFCDQEIKEGNGGPEDDVCNVNECRNRYKVVCKKQLPCGHKCFGVNGETKCPPCIDKECRQFNGQFGQNKDNYCTICYTEGLGSSPIVELSCGHYMHYLCLKTKLEKRWISPKITFKELKIFIF